MQNIIIYAKEENSNIAEFLKEKSEYDVRVKNISEIKEYEILNPSVIIIDIPKDEISNILATTKFTVPVLIVSDEILDLFAVRAEAYDYILSPVNKKELFIRVQNLIKIHELRVSISKVSTTDELTGLYNRKHLHQRLEAELSRSKRYNISLSCLLLDIDNFKVINDMYGYDCGDVLLKRIAQIVAEHARKEDIVTRYGDEEFLVLLPNTNEENAYLFAERLRRDIAKMEFIPEGEEEAHPIAISGGVSSYPFLSNVDENTNTIIRYAEHALYNAKHRGKNKIVQFSQVNLEM